MSGGTHTRTLATGNCMMNCSLDANGMALFRRPIKKDLQMRDIEVQIDKSCGTKGLPYELLALAGKITWSANELNAFALIALGTAPPTYVGFTLAETWAHQRYAAALDSRKKELRLRPEWVDVDPHQKTILADDWGVGFSLMYLTEKIALSYFSPTGWWLKAVEVAIGKKLKIPKKKTGPPKLPDYIGIDAYGYMHALECKGTQQSQAHLRKQIKDGVKQVENLRGKSVLPSKIRRSFRGWMVGGLYVPQTTSKKSPLLIIADPDFSDLEAALNISDGIKIAKNAVRLTMLCQQLSAIGLPRLATTLFNGKANSNDIDFIRDSSVGGGEAGFMQLLKSGTDFSFRRTARVFESSDRVASSGRVYDFDYSIPGELLVAITKTISRNGIVDAQGLLDVLDGVAPIIDSAVRKKALKESPTLPSGWESTVKRGSSSLRSPFGIKIVTTSSPMNL